MQRAYLTALYDLAMVNSHVISIIADSGTGYDELFRRDFPEQFFDFGISEEHMVAAAAGMASCGMIPFVYTAGAFLAYRSYEFIRDDVCFQKQNVKIIGMGSGLAWSTLGPTHHTTEDYSVLRSLPNLTILSPASPLEVGKVVKAAYEIDGPVYIRLGMSGEPEIYDQDYEFCIGKSNRIKDGNDIVIFSTGAILPEVIEAAKMLEDKNVSVRVVNIHTLKPLNSNSIIEEIENMKFVFTVEEHNILGGLGGAIAEIIAESNIYVPFKRIGLPDSFARGYGTVQEVREANALDARGIFALIRTCLPRATA